MTCMLNSLRRFAAYYRPHKWLFILDMATAVMQSGFAICIPMLVRNTIKYDLPAQEVNRIAASLGIALALVGLMSLASYVNIRFGHYLGTRMETDMRADLFGHLQKLSFTYFDNTKTGHIISRISNDLFTIAEVAHHAPEDLFISLTTIIGSFALMFSISPTMAVLSIAPLPFMVLWGAVYGTKMRRGFKTVRERIADINSSVENSIQGIREVKSFTNEDHQIGKFGEVNKEFKSAKEGMYSIMASFHGGMMFMMEAYSLVIIGGGTALVYYGRIDLADLIGFQLYVPFIIGPVRRMVNFIEQMQQGMASFDRFIEIMDVEPDIVDRPGAVEPGEIKGDIALKDLWFKYEGSEDWVLRDVNLRVPAGSSAALVGESGAGKSTLAALIPRFYEAQKGTLAIDGIDVRDITQRALRRNIGIVQQNVFMFDATLRENIMFGDPQAGDEQLVEAAKNANIYEFIKSLPDGFDTQVGEHGVKLSGGQKQRVSIARVFLKNPPILIFDEATSSLDTESESLIRSAMEKLSEGRTTIIIAHRLSTVRNADYTYVLRSGRIVEEGTHDELMGRNGYYSELHAHSVF